MRPRVFLAIAACACAATPLPALGAMTTARDARDRPIVFDVRAKSADVAGYADVLRRSVHGDEIRTVSIRVVPRSRIRAHCRDARAVACYSGALGRGIITIPVHCFRIGRSGRNGKGGSAIRHFHHHQFGIFAGGDGDRVLRPDGQAITRACFHAIDLR